MLVAIPARADDELAEARRLEAALEYEQALALVDRALAHGGAEPGRVAELHLLAGRLAAGLDRAAVAEDHFARALALRPETKLPDGTSPKLTAPFDAARARGVPPLVVTVRASRGLVTIEPHADPLGLVVGVQAHLESHGNHFEVTERASLRVIVPIDAIAVEIDALDASGNRVWAGPAPTGPLTFDELTPKVVAPPPRGSRAIIARWQTWAISGAAFAIAGGAFAYWSSSLQTEWNQQRSQDGLHDFSALKAIEDRGRRDAIAADIGFGIAGAAAITSLVLLATNHDNSPIIVGAGTVGVAGRF